MVLGPCAVRPMMRRLLVASFSSALALCLFREGSVFYTMHQFRDAQKWSKTKQMSAQRCERAIRGMISMKKVKAHGAD